MRDGAHAVAPAAHAHAAGGDGVVEFVAGAAGFGDIEVDEVCLDFGGVDADAGDLGQAMGQQLGVGVVLGQAVDVVAQGVDAGGGDDAGLTHGPAELVFVAAR